MCRTRKAEQPVDSLFSGSLKKARLVINRWVNKPEKWTSLTDCARKEGYTGDLSNLHREARRLKLALDKIPVTSAPPASAPAISAAAAAGNASSAAPLPPTRATHLSDTIQYSSPGSLMPQDSP